MDRLSRHKWVSIKLVRLWSLCTNLQVVGLIKNAKDFFECVDLTITSMSHCFSLFAFWDTSDILREYCFTFKSSDVRSLRGLF
jgi:hypothetical protein